MYDVSFIYGPYLDKSQKDNRFPLYFAFMLGWKNNFDHRPLPRKKQSDIALRINKRLNPLINQEEPLF